MIHLIRFWRIWSTFQPWHKIQNDFIDQLDGTKERFICKWYVCCWKEWSLIETLRRMHWGSWLHHAQGCAICFMHPTDTWKSRYLSHWFDVIHVIWSIQYGSYHILSHMINFILRFPICILDASSLRHCSSIRWRRPNLCSHYCKLLFDILS